MLVCFVQNGNGRFLAGAKINLLTRHLKQCARTISDPSNMLANVRLYQKSLHVPIAILYAFLIESPLYTHALDHPIILKIVPIILKSF